MRNNLIMNFHCSECGTRLDIKTENEQSNEMNAEKLKVIAGGMGYKIHLVGESGVFVESKINYSGTPLYCPDTASDTQCMEIMEKLPVDISKQSTQTVGKPETEKSYWMAGARYFNKKGEFVRVLEEGKTIKEAVCNVAYEYFEGQQE